jgi:D-arabinose 1-dehydrogenase-like Zn-dependent alcohol dehydrogenase
MALGPNEVTGVCSTAKMDLVRSVGADHVIDYTRAGIADGVHRYDVIIDIGGNRPLRRLRAALTRRGTLAIVGGETGGRWLGGFDRSLRAPVLSRFVRQRLAAVMVSENAADLVVLAELVESGQVTPVIDRTYPLSQAPTPSGTCSTATPAGRSSSPSEALRSFGTERAWLLASPCLPGISAKSRGGPLSIRFPSRLHIPATHPRYP